jgi:hypothetical protein
MLQWGAWYSTIRGLGFQPKEMEGGKQEVEGQQNAENTPSSISQLPSSAKAPKPTAGIWFGPEFSTANEVSDCAFRGLPMAIQGGTDKTKGQAEVALERCLFEQCEIGLLLGNWNSLDWWLWDCEFLQCGLGVSNSPGCGNFNIYRCRFNGSTRSDIKIGNLGGFAMVENESRDSRMFLYMQRGNTAGANLTLQGNRISGAKYEEKMPSGILAQGLSIRLGNPGPVLMLDNQFIRPGGATGVDVYFNSASKVSPIGTALLMGNTTTGTKMHEAEKGYEVRVMDDPGSDTKNRIPGQANEISNMGDRISETNKVDSRPISHIPYSITANTTVVEIEAGAGGDQIQAAIDGAKDGAVVHLPAGSYSLSRPLAVRAGQTVKIRGDGMLNSTALVPEGDFGVRGLVEVQPGGRLEMQDLALQAPIRGGGAVGVVVNVSNANQVVVCGDQVQTTGFGPGLVVEGVDDGRVVLRNHGHNGVTVLGGSEARTGVKISGQVELMCGASSRDKGLKPETPIYEVRQGGRILVRDIWYEGDPPEFMRVSDRGDIVFVGGHVAPNKGKGHTAVNAVQMDGQAGSVLMAQAALNGADLTIGKLAQGFLVTLFGLTPYPETSIQYADRDGISDMGDGRSKVEQPAATRNAISNIPSSISTNPRGPGFVQLMCRQNNTKITGSEPLADVNADGDIAGRLQALRDWRLPDPDLDAPIKLHRVSCTGSIGMVVVSARPKSDKK